MDWMEQAIALAARGEGAVEPNPMVGCVIVRDGRRIGAGWHKRFGGPHAEIEAIRDARKAHGTDAVRGATVYVTLEPCAHHGKTPPCAEALVEAGVARVVYAVEDPFPAVAGRGRTTLEQAGIAVEVGEGEAASRELLAPYLKRLGTGQPFVIAKWAMTLDGRIATATGDSRWVTGQTSRYAVHALRGRVDAIVVGRRTVEADDPALTARPPGLRTPVRVVLDEQALTPPSAKLVTTARDVPTMIVVAEEAMPADEVSVTARLARIEAFQAAGVEVLIVPGGTRAERWRAFLVEGGRRGWTNVLLEGGASVLATAFETNTLDEVHAFVAPKLIGGQSALSPIGGLGRTRMAEAVVFRTGRWETLDGDVVFVGRVASPTAVMPGVDNAPRAAK